MTILELDENTRNFAAAYLFEARLWQGQRREEGLAGLIAMIEILVTEEPSCQYNVVSELEALVPEADPMFLHGLVILLTGDDKHFHLMKQLDDNTLKLHRPHN